MYNLRAVYHYNEGAFEKAIEDCKKSLEILHYGWTMNRIFKSYVRLGRDQEALSTLKEMTSLDPSLDYIAVIDTVFRESGIQGLIEWYIQWLQENNSVDFFSRINLNTQIAGLYGLMGDSQQAIAWLEKAVEAGESSLLGIEFSRDLTFLKDDPRFKAIYNEMGL
jgi:tetratricopeptide (TPR) repeat protein